MKTHRDASDLLTVKLFCSRIDELIYFRQARDVQTLSMFHSGFARLAGPSPFALTVCEARPGEDIMVGQVQICRVHSKLADQLQQAR